MKPQELKIECECFDELRERLNAALHSVIDALIEKQLPTGTVAAKIGIAIHHKTDEETGEVLLMPEFKPDVSLKIGGKGKIELGTICGIYLKQTEDGSHLVASNQISIDDLMAEQKGA